MDNNKQFLGRMLKHSRQREKAPRAWPNWSQGCMYAKSLQSCLTLCNAMDCSLPGSFVHGILQARILEWLPCPPSGDLPNPGIKSVFLTSPTLADGFFTTSSFFTTSGHLEKPQNEQYSAIYFPLLIKLTFCFHLLFHLFYFYLFIIFKIWQFCRLLCTH